MFTFTGNQSIKGVLNFGVVAIAVKRDSPPYSRDYISDTNFFDLTFKFFQKGRRAARLGAATVKDHVQINLVQSMFLCHAQ